MCASAEQTQWHSGRVGKKGCAVVYRETINGIPVVIEVRPVGGLGWTWSYDTERGNSAKNPGKLLPSESQAVAAARAAALACLGGKPG
jgi:hypothetical protein